MNTLKSTKQQFYDENPVQLVAIDDPEILIIQPIGGDVFISSQSAGIKENGFLLVSGQTLAFGRADFVPGKSVEFWAVRANSATNPNVRITYREA